MKKIILALAMAGAAFAAASPAGAQTPQPAQQCLRNNQIDSFSSIKGELRAIVVTDRFRNKYKVSFNTPCEGVDYNGALAIRSQANTGLACVGRGDMVISRDTAGWSGRCVVTQVQPYTAAMQQADAARAASR